MGKTATTEKLDPKGREPLYMQLYRSLKERITAGTWPSGSALPSISLLAAEYGVSIITVESALRILIDEGFCFRRPKKGTFVTVSAPAPRERNGRRTILLYAPGVIESSSHLSLLNHFIHNEARVRQINVLHTFGDIEEEVQHLLKEPGICLEGVVLMYPEGVALSTRLALKHPEVRIVHLNYQFENFETTPPNLFGVFSDEVGGGYAMTSYLLQQGCRDIAVVTCDNSDINYTMRIEGYVMALDHFSVPFNQENIVVTVNPDPLDAVRSLHKMGEEGLRQVLRRKVPDAIFFLNDLMAAAASDCLRREYPELKVRLAGYDNFIPELSLSCSFPTVEVDLRRMGMLTVRLLVADDLPRVKCVRCPTTLLQR